MNGVFSTIDVLVIALVAIHLHLEYRIWFRREQDVFAKYRSEKMAPMVAAKWAYYAKALWLLLLILLQYFGLAFRDALAISFLVYALVIQIAFPPKLYNLLNLALALACLLQLILSWR